MSVAVARAERLRHVRNRARCLAKSPSCCLRHAEAAAEAYLRIRAARLCRQFPRVLQMMAAGELHLSAIKLIAPILNDESTRPRRRTEPCIAARV